MHKPRFASFRTASRPRIAASITCFRCATAGLNCPKCDRPAKYSRVQGRRAYQCHWCANQLYPTAGTPFDRTRTSLRDWFYVMFLFTTTRNGVAAKRVEREIGVTYKTAWRMCHEIRKYMARARRRRAYWRPRRSRSG